MKRNLFVSFVVCALLLQTGLAVGARGATRKPSSGPPQEVVVRPGDSLALIAARHLGSKDRWQEIARLNGISNPQQLKVGQKLKLPTGAGEAAPDNATGAHLPAVPSLLKLAGAVRWRSGVADNFKDLYGAEAISGGTWIMTANTGRAELAVGTGRIEIMPFSVVQVTEAAAEPAVATVALSLGELRLRSGTARLRVQDATGAATLAAATDLRVSRDEQGRFKLTVVEGSAEFVSVDGSRQVVAAGGTLTARQGEKPTPQPTAITLRQPSEAATVEDQDVLFEWTDSGSGARLYRFTLKPGDPARPSVEEKLEKSRLIVRNLPEGGYSWQVWPMEGRNVTPSAPGAFTVARARAELQVSLLPMGAGWKIQGRTNPGALVKVGTTALTANDSGRFEYDLPAADGVAVIGIEARLREGGAPARRGVAVAGKCFGGEAQAVAILPAGEVKLGDRALPAAIGLTEGRNRLVWAWQADGAVADQGEVEVYWDRTPPEITSVRASAPKINSGDSLTIFVTARDNGVGLGAPSSATLTMVGPDNYSRQVKAQRVTANGEYVFTLQSPSEMKDGVLRVSRLEIQDAEGNAAIVTSEGMATENVDPRTPVRRFFINLIFLGIGVAIGAL